MCKIGIRAAALGSVAMAIAAVLAMGMGGAPWTETKIPTRAALPLRVTPVSCEPLPVGSERAIVRDKQERAPLRDPCGVKAHSLRGHLSADKGRTSPEEPLLLVFCYELLPRDSNGCDPYSWSMWRTDTLGRRSFGFSARPRRIAISLLGEGPFPEYYTLSVVKVTFPRDRVVAFSEDLDGDPTTGVDLLTWRPTQADLRQLPVPAAPDQKPLRLAPTSLKLDAEGRPVVEFAVAGTDAKGTLAVKDGRLVCVNLQP